MHKKLADSFSAKTAVLKRKYNKSIQNHIEPVDQIFALRKAFAN